MNAAVQAMENMPYARRRWLILATVAVAQLMIVLDLTIVNVALPSAQRSLHFATVDRQWVVTAYALAFGWPTDPLLPPRVVLDRNRGGAYLAMLFVSAGVFGIFLFLAFYLQTTLGYSPLVTGLAFLPFPAAVVASVNVGQIVLMPRTGPKPLVGLGLLIAAGGVVWLTRIGVHSGYASGEEVFKERGPVLHLARMLRELMPAGTEVRGLYALPAELVAVDASLPAARVWIALDTGRLEEVSDALNAAEASGPPDTHLRVLRTWSAAMLGLPSGAEHQ